MIVFFRDAEGQIRHLPRRAFREEVSAGRITADTPVFDLSITTLGELRDGRFERPAGTAWHATAFRIPQQAA